MIYTIRPFQAEDYPAATRIYNAQNEPHHQITEQELRRSYERAQERSFVRLLTAVADDEVIATGEIGERIGDNPPGKFWGWFHVREDHQGTGVDSALFDATLKLLAGRAAESIWTCIRQDFVPAAAYLEEREFQEQFRSWGASLNLDSFESSAYLDNLERLAELGIRLRTFTDLSSDPARDKKIAALQAELEEDAPHYEPIIPKRHPRPHDPETLTGSYVVAEHSGTYIGLAGLTEQQRSPTDTGAGLVGVKRQYRGQGVGTALLAHTATWAKERGYEEVTGGGAGTNTAMLKTIARVGFDVEPAWITFAKFL